MDAIVLCGGRGTRLDADVEKPLVAVCGVPMLERVAEALGASGVEQVYAAVSPHAPRTRERAVELGLRPVDTPGEGYVADLDRALAVVGRPALTVVADLPLVDADLVDRALDASGGESLSVTVPAALKRRLGVSADTTFERAGRTLAPAGLNVVGESDDELLVSYDARLAVNVNRSADLAVAEDLCP